MAAIEAAIQSRTVAMLAPVTTTTAKKTAATTYYKNRQLRTVSRPFPTGEGEAAQRSEERCGVPASDRRQNIHTTSVS